MRFVKPLTKKGQQHLSQYLINSLPWALANLVVATGFVAQTGWNRVATAEFLPYCQQTAEGIAKKETARRAALKGDKNAQKRYKSILAEQADQLRKCRNQNWLKNQGLWIRLYPCDTQPGVLEEVLDRIVDRGYNQIYVESFYNGQVLLPAADNPTSWASVVRAAGAERVDLLAEVIRKGRDRGLSVYAWMFSMNFGYPYATRPDKQSTIAKDGNGRTSLNANTIAGLSTDLGLFNPHEAFIDPYSLQAKQDYYQMAQAIAQRRPDGMLFDYIRYPRGRGSASLATRVQDLWIYGESAQQAILQRALNNKGRELIKRYLTRGSISPSDITDVDKLFPQETDPPLWQGRTPVPNENRAYLSQRHQLLSIELWRFGVAHAMQGVVDFLNTAAAPAQSAGMPTGAVFFPEGNQTVGRGFDSRLQPWDRFSASMEWHPMVYGVCGNAGCIVNQVRRVLSQAPAGTKVRPVLAGIWQQSVSNRPPLEVQMEAIRQTSPQISSLSHFAYSWQEPQSDRDRKSCQVKR